MVAPEWTACNTPSSQIRVCAHWWRRRQWHPTPALLPGKSHGWRSLVGCCPWGHKESDTTEWLPFHFSLSCLGEGNGNPLQCSSLENPRDGGAWWAAVYGVTPSQTRLKQLSSSSSSSLVCFKVCFSTALGMSIAFLLTIVNTLTITSPHPHAHTNLSSIHFSTVVYIATNIHVLDTGTKTEYEKSEWMNSSLK